MDLTPHLEQLKVDGYTIVERLIDDATIDALLKAVHDVERRLGSAPSNNRFEGRHTVRTYNLLARDPIWQSVPVQPEVLTLIESMLGPQCLVSSLASISLAPGESAQVLHADDQIMPIAKPHVATVANSMWALTDFTERNGATRVVPGSHLWDHEPDYFAEGSPYPTIAAEMPKGSVLVWHGSTWHGGGANTSDEVRVGVAMNYCAGYIRQQENQQLGIPADVMATFSPQLRELCGLGMYRGLIGNLDKASPAEVLYGDPPQLQVWDAEPI
ncbi:MAG: phytanoyl-CoA dioxygenase family protein [Acidimicrobiales bacterium]